MTMSAVTRCPRKRVNSTTLYTWRTRRVGFGPRAVKMGGCLRYRRADLDTWIVEHLEPAEGE